MCLWYIEEYDFVGPGRDCKPWYTITDLFVSAFSELCLFYIQFETFFFLLPWKEVFFS